MGRYRLIYRLNDENKNLPFLIEQKYGKKFLRKHLWKYDYFITKILFRSIFRTPNWDGYHKLSGEELMDKFGQIRVKGKSVQWAHSIIRSDLKEWGYILYYNIFNTIEGKTKEEVRYKILDEVRTKGWHRIRDHEINELKNIDKPVLPRKEVYKVLEEEITHLTIHPLAIKFCYWGKSFRIQLKPKKRWYGWDFNRTFNDESYSSYLTAIDRYLNKDHTLIVDSNGRCYHLLVYTPKILRPFVRYDNQLLYEIDVRNSQPLLLCPGMRRWAEENNKSLNDINEYQSLCEKAEFYKYVQELIMKSGEEITNDNTFKPDFFEKIFFSTENRHWKWRKIFDQCFPTVSEYITHLKIHNHANAAISLQKQEASIMIDDALSNIYQEGYRGVIVLHDAMFCTESNKKMVEQKVIEAYKRVGVNPLAKITCLVDEYSNEFLDWLEPIEKGELLDNFSNPPF